MSLLQGKLLLEEKKNELSVVLIEYGQNQTQYLIDKSILEKNGWGLCNQGRWC